MYDSLRSPIMCNRRNYFEGDTPMSKHKQLTFKYILTLLLSLCLFIGISFQIYKNVQSMSKSNIAKDAPVFMTSHLEESFLQPIIDIDQVTGFDKHLVAYLTFDDGPSNYTSGILDTLDTYGVKATFFMLEPQMKQYPKIVNRMNEAGHALGLHSVSHDHRKFYKSPTSVVSEMEQTLHTLESITGESTPLIRTPYGSKPYMKQEYMDAVEAHHFILWDWNVDSLDWQYRDKRFVDETLRQVKNLQNKEQAPVILMHDLRATEKFLPVLLDALINMGYEFQPLNDKMKPIQLINLS